MSLTAAGDIGFGRGEFDVRTLGDVVGFAKLMATSGLAIPKHLRDNPGACMAITLDALHLKMSPYLLARQSYFVNDMLAYMSQVFSAAINTAPIMRKRPTVSFLGDGEDRVCRVVLHLIDGDQETDSPKFSKITPKNSPLWKNDPDQQQSYYTKRAAARRHCPEILLGMMDVEEAQTAQPIIENDAAGTGMIERLQARSPEVDPAGFNVRSIVEETKPTIEEILEGDHIPDHLQDDTPPPPKRRGRRSNAEIAAAKAAEEAAQGEEPPLETDGAPSAEPEPASLDSATDASGDSVEGTSSPDQPNEPSSAGATNPDVDRFYAALEAAKGLADLKAALMHFRRSETYKAAQPALHREWQGGLYERIGHMRDEGITLPEPEADVWIFSIYLIVTDDDGDLIDSVYDALKESDAYSNLSPDQKVTLDTAVSNRLAQE